MGKQWALKPGEKKSSIIVPIVGQEDTIMEKFAALSDQYMENNDYKRTVILNDHYEIVFFVGFYQDNKARDNVDVAIYNGEEYVFLPKELADDTANSYFKYVDSVANVYDYFEGE